MSAQQQDRQPPSIAAVLETLSLAWLIYCTQYRLRLAAVLQDQSGEAWSDALLQAWGQGWSDLPILLALLGFALLLRLPLQVLPASWRGWKVWSVLGLMLAAPVLGLIGSHSNGWLRVLDAMHEGVTWTLVQETATSGELSAMIGAITPGDALDIVLPWAVLLMVWPLRWGHLMAPWSRRLALGGLVSLWPLGAILAPPLSPVVASEATLNPAVYTLWDGWQRDFAPIVDGAAPQTAVSIPNADKSAAANPPDLGLAQAATGAVANDAQVGTAPTGGMRLPAPDYADVVPTTGADPAALHLPGKLAPGGKPWNIVWLILESTGRLYLDGAAPAEHPMPYLRSLQAQGWNLAKHRSPSNSSATSIFAQFSGLYPSPSIWMFATQPNNRIPSLFAFLPKQYERFLYTPGKLDFFFPKPFLQASGLQEMQGFTELSRFAQAPGSNAVRDEAAVVGAFTERLAAAKPPFAAVYYSYAAHWEYIDHGPKYRRFDVKKPLGRYLNNLVFLDAQIARIMRALHANNLADSTIVVIAGDHGEAFGQHPRNWTHSRASFDENLATPGLLWQPALFAPRQVTMPTSHIDLLPTVLDALGLPYDDALFQGESLFASVLRRKYQFFWGNEGTVSLLGRDGQKVLWSTTDQKCWAYDTARDPAESRKLGCDRFAAEAALLRRYKEEQRQRLLAYSAAMAAGQPYQGRRHPALPSSQQPAVFLPDEDDKPQSQPAAPPAH